MHPIDLRNADPAVRFQSALAAMRNKGFLKSPKYQQQQKRALREGAHPHIVEFSDKLVKRMREMGIPMFAHCIVRTADQQQAAFDLGVSNDSPKDGLWPHQAFAVDIIHGVAGWMDKPVIPLAWEVVGHIGKEVAKSIGVSVVWGGDFRRFPDPAHWELADWKLIAVQGDKHWQAIKL